MAIEFGGTSFGEVKVGFGKRLEMIKNLVLEEVARCKPVTPSRCKIGVKYKILST